MPYTVGLMVNIADLTANALNFKMSTMNCKNIADSIKSIWT